MHLITSDHRPASVFGAREGCQRDCWDLPAFLNRQSSDLANELISVSVRHANVADDDVWFERGNLLKPFDS
jgi:hypothetical protein